MLPTISIVTPSYNQAEFLPATIESILSQRYPQLEYVIMDGGSTDGSVEIIHRYASQLQHWSSAPDAGQYSAINAGFAQTTGEIMGWLNSDDQYTPWALRVIGELFAQLPQVEWISTIFPLNYNTTGAAVNCLSMDGFNKQAFLRGENLPGLGRHASSFIQQESTFWRRSLWERAGGHLDTSWKLAADFELWARFYQHTELYGVATPLGGFRAQPHQKTSLQMNAYAKEAQAILRQYGGRPYTSRETIFCRRWSRYFPRRLTTTLGLSHARHVCECNARTNRWQIDTRCDSFR